MPRRDGVWQARNTVEGLERDKERYQKHQSWEYSLCLWVSVQCYLLEKSWYEGKNHFKVSCWHSLPEVKDRTKPELEFFPRVIFKVAPAHQINITSWHKGKSTGDADVCFVLCWQQEMARGWDSGSSAVTLGSRGATTCLPSLPGRGARHSSTCLAVGLAQLRTSSAQAPGGHKRAGQLNLENQWWDGLASVTKSDTNSFSWTIS